MIADDILKKSPYKKLRTNRYSSFDSGKGADYEAGIITLEDLREYAFATGEPIQTSGKQEMFENIVNQYI